MTKSPTYAEVLHFLTTSKGRMLGKIVRETEGLSLEGLKDIRHSLSDPNLIIIADSLIRDRERTV